MSCDKFETDADRFFSSRVIDRLVSPDSLSVDSVVASCQLTKLFCPTYDILINPNPSRFEPFVVEIHNAQNTEIPSFQDSFLSVRIQRAFPVFGVRKKRY